MRKGLGWLVLPLLMLMLGIAQAQTGKVTYVYTDPQGTPLAEADANGNITATFDYKPYGSQALGSPSTGPGYTGHVNDPDTGFVYMQARYYDPSMGRFLSVDPVHPTPGDAFNFGRYAYVNNNPINHTDPTGKCLEDLCIGEAILLTEGVEYLVTAYEASEAVAITTEAATATTAATTTTTASTLTQAAVQCAANTTCTGLAATTATAVTAKVLQTVQATSTVQLAKEHTKNARPSSKGKHEKGNSRRKRDAGNEKGDGNRRPPKQRPPNYKGPWPPKEY